MRQYLVSLTLGRDPHFVNAPRPAQASQGWHPSDPRIGPVQCKRGNRFFQWTHNRSQRLQLADSLLGFFLIVPETWVALLAFDFGDLLLLGGVVKESP